MEGSGSKVSKVGTNPVFGFTEIPVPITSVSDKDPDGSGFFAVRIRVLKVRIRPFINLSDLNDGFGKVLEEPDQKR